MYTIDGEYTDIEISLDIYETLQIDTYMCTTDCPCVPLTQATKGTWSDAAITGSSSRTVGDFYFVSANGFETYEACIQSYDSTATTPFGIWAHNLNTQSNFDEIMDWITFFEDEFDCAGVCEPAMFYWSKSVTLGAPTDSCVGSIKDELSTAFIRLCGACLVSGFILLCNFLLQYCMWFKSSDDK